MNKIKFKKTNETDRKINTRYLKLLYLLKWDIKNNFQNFDVVFQPQVDTNTQKTEGVEALLRWRCEEFGAISPLEFIPILEENSLIKDIGEWVLRRTLETYKKEWQQYKPDLSLNVNVSFKQVFDKNFVKNVQTALEENEVNPKNLTLELTENCMVANINRGIKIYRMLKDLGVNVALDDFGTGYSSLGVLKELPVDIIKTDRIFIKDILESNFDKLVIKFIIDICHEVKMKVCIEGVEREEEYKLIKEMGADYIQGFYFGKPVSKDEITDRLKSENKNM